MREKLTQKASFHELTLPLEGLVTDIDENILMFHYNGKEVIRKDLSGIENIYNFYKDNDFLNNNDIPFYYFIGKLKKVIKDKNAERFLQNISIYYAYTLLKDKKDWNKVNTNLTKGETLKNVASDIEKLKEKIKTYLKS